jgi:hypothetical protein
MQRPQQRRGDGGQHGGGIGKNTSISNGGNGWHDGDAKATAMDGAKAMRWQCDGD